MKEIRFEAITLHAFKAFVQETTIALDGPGVHFVSGRNDAEPALGANGVGKTTIFDAIAWCLYGETPDGLRTTDVAPWGMDGGRASVVLRLSVNGAPYVIEREPGVLSINGTGVYQAAIEDLLSLSRDVFLHTVLLGQGQPLFFDLQPKAKLDLLTTVLNLDRWDTRADYAKERASKLEAAVNRLTGEYVGLERELERVDSLHDQVTQESTAWEQHQFELKRLAKARLKQLQTEAGKATALCHDLEKRMTLASAELVKLEQQVNDLHLKYIEAYSAEQARHAAHDTIKEELAAATSKKRCPLCGQRLQGQPEVHLKAMRTKVVELAKAADRSKTQMERTNTTWLKARAKAEDSKRELAEMARTKLGAEHALDATLAEAERLREIREHTNPHAATLAMLQEDHERLQNDLLRIQDEADKKQMQAERTRFWVKGFVECKLFILDRVLEEIEWVAATLLPEMGMADWRLVIAAARETKAGTVKRGVTIGVTSPRSPEGVKWEVWSGGEAQRLRLVGTMALSEVLLNRAGVSVNLEVFDEPTRGLSREGVANLCEALASRATRLAKSIWLVDHHAISSSAFASTNLVVLGDAGSEIRPMA